MKTYQVRIPYFCTVIVEVEANSTNEAKSVAIAKAYPPSLCYRCSDGIEMDEMNDDAEIIVEQIII